CFMHIKECSSGLQEFDSLDCQIACHLIKSLVTIGDTVRENVKKAQKNYTNFFQNLVLSCLATGFYPRDIEMNIRLDRTVLGNQISSGIRPNDDKTFQLRTSVEIDRNHKGSYDCFVIHSNLTEPASVEWGKYH
uniref:Immunoglobulin C1-set domain-containing protein n=1 Tax=Sinocyclocheilus grahami TaxID=75366 RepID=A0A672K4M1_SINGR